MMLDHCLLPLYFTTPTISENEGASARLIELIAITAGLTLLHTLNLEGEVASDISASSKYSFDPAPSNTT